MSEDVSKLATLGVVLVVGVGGAIAAFALGATDLANAVLALSAGILIPGPHR